MTGHYIPSGPADGLDITFQAGKPSSPDDNAIWCDTSDYSFWVYSEATDSWYSMAEMSFHAAKSGTHTGNHYLRTGDVSFGTANHWYLGREYTITGLSLANAYGTVPGVLQGVTLYKKIGFAAQSVLETLNYDGVSNYIAIRDLAHDIPIGTGFALRVLFNASGTPALNTKCVMYYRWRLDG